MPYVGGTISGEVTKPEVTFSLSTSIYASGDVLADTQEVTGALLNTAGGGIIESIVVIDQDAQAQALDLVFLDTDGSLGTENSAVGPTDAVAAKILGIIPVLASDYKSLVNSQVATLTNVGLAIKAASNTTSIYLGAVSRGTGTYTASGILVRMVILQV